MTRAEVYRIRYSLRLDQVAEDGRPAPHRVPSPFSIVIKSGPRDLLQKSHHAYAELPDPLKRYFARHSGEPQVFETHANAPAYLVLEDLTDDYEPLYRAILDADAPPRLSNAHRTVLDSACAVVAESLVDIHRQTHRPYPAYLGSQLARIYFSPIERHLLSIQRRFPGLEGWFTGFRFYNRRFRSVYDYLALLADHQEEFALPSLALAHGDCHSRNILWSRKARALKFIDLDKLDHHGDYLLDVARLLADVTLYPLFDVNSPHFVTEAQIQVHQEKVAVTRYRVQYPPFYRSAGQHFQEQFLGRLQAYAELEGDTTWKERLWLAGFRNILTLVDRAVDEKHAIVVYSEAMKLLAALAMRVEKGVELPPTLWEGPAAAGAGAPSAQPKPLWRPDEQALRDLHRALVSTQPPLAAVLRAGDLDIRYFLAGVEEPIALLERDEAGPSRPDPVAPNRARPRLLLNCRPSELGDRQALALKTGYRGAWRSMVRLDTPFDVAEVAEVVGKVQRLKDDEVKSMYDVAPP